MNDRFRFRVWNNREWDDEYGQVYYDAENTYDYLRGKPQVPASSFGELLEDDQWIVEQCTGLKDKNGKLIYEGDIVITHLKRRGIILWNEICWCYRTLDKASCTYIMESYDIEIIGNIHENPELLKESK